MGKRRNTAKTGDKAMYKGRDDDDGKRKKHADDDDNMYDKVDRFHNERDQEFLQFDAQEENSDDEDLTGNQEAVLDLGVGGSSSSEDDDSSSDDDDDDSLMDNAKKESGKGDDSDDSSGSSDSDSDDADGDSDDDDEEIKDLRERLAEAEDPRKWGKKKSMYYHGDTADLEIGQEEEDAFLEEEAAKEIQKSRFEEMEEDDFELSGDEGDQHDSDKKTFGTSELQIKTSRDTSKLTKKEARKLLQKQHPELLPMVSYFADIVKDLKERTDVAAKALLESQETAESVGATVQGQQYLITKAILQKSIALNSVMYLLLKSSSEVDDEGHDSIQAHPITDQIKSLYSAFEKLEDMVKGKASGIDKQVDSLVKAAALLKGDAILADEESESEEENVGQEDFEMDEDENVSEKEDEHDDENSDHEAEMAAIAAMRQKKNYDRTVNEARFGLRPEEIRKASTKVSRKRQQSNTGDFGDMDDEKATKLGVGVLASTINSIEQRSQAASRKRRAAPIAEQLDELDEDDRLAQGIKMMEEELGKLDGEDADAFDDEDDDEMGDDEIMDPDANDESLDFYNKMERKSKSKRAFKKSLYEVAPKFPRSDGLVDGERAISRTILKNRGLVAHKAKINRNPRVKKREQYRKALIRRKGAVREVREGEGHQYGGEGTGIKSNISRSRKL